MNPSVFYFLFLNLHEIPQAQTKYPWLQKQALAKPTSTGSKGERTEVAKKPRTKEKRPDPQLTSDSKQKTLEGAPQTIEVRKNATFDQSTFTTLELAQRFHLHFANQTVIPSRNIDFSKLSYFHFDMLFARMGWLPIVSVKEFLYPRVVKCFYCNMKFEDERPISTTINDIPNEGVCLYEAKKWPRVEGFKVAEAIQRLCGYLKSGRPTSHSLTVLRGHRDDVSFLEAFLVDRILTERKVNMGYIIFWHAKACSLSKDSVLPYGMFITKIVKYFNKLKSFDTYDRASLRRMHFVRKKNGSWERKSSVPPSEDEEYKNQDVEARTSKNANVTPIPLKDGVGARVDAYHPSQIGRNEAETSNNLTAQISSLGTYLEEMTLTRIDGFHEEFKASMKVILGQHDEMMLFLRAYFPLHGQDHI
ncbi:hypothetical protein PVL29_013652 [Vitis rotundifolia]|uniref:Uncharacterized protein n=1 Tax=Vitis rotundifolia TaxID=103349 RepID=A0AA38ZLZ0_VITRO|nr:hypothetical protein PVL29_013652 [Vitis rotundifolia]